MKIYRRVVRYRSLKADEKSLFYQALSLLIVWRLRILFLPMRRYVQSLGEKGKEVAEQDTGEDLVITKVPAAIRRADSLLPWKSKCLTEAIATKLLLERHKVKSTLFLGVAKDEKDKLIAHAWIKLGDKILSGGRDYQKFTVVQKFT